MQQRTKVLLTLGGGILVLLAAALIVLRDVRLEFKLTGGPEAPLAGVQTVPTTISVTPHGLITVGDTATTLEQLPDTIDQAYRRSGGTLPRAHQTILISAGPTVRYGDVSAIWERLQDAGWWKAFRVDPTDDGGGD